MKLEQIEYVIATKEFGSMHEAARQLHVSQQCISKAIKNFEDELGVNIFQRKNTGSLLTKEGYDIYLHLKNVMKEIEYLQKKYVYSNSKKIKGLLDIYCPISYGTLFENTVMSISQEHSNVSINLIEDDSSVFFDLLKSNSKLELVFLQSSLEEIKIEEKYLSKNYFCYLIKKEQLKVLMSRSSPFAEKKKLSKKDLSSLPFAIKSNAGEENSTYLKILRENGLDLNVKFRSNSIISMIDLVTKNAAFAFTTDSIFTELYSNLSLCSIPIKDIYVYLFMIVNKYNLSPVSELFLTSFNHTGNYEKIF